MNNIFISYSHDNTAYVEKLIARLQQEGFSPWIDERIEYGDLWPQELQRRLDVCSAFIVIMTRDAFESPWVQNELSRAQSRDKPIYPLLLDGEVWLSVQAIQYSDVRSGDLPPDSFFEQLAQVVPRPFRSPVVASPSLPTTSTPPTPTPAVPVTPPAPDNRASKSSAHPAPRPPNTSDRPEPAFRQRLLQIALVLAVLALAAALVVVFSRDCPPKNCVTSTPSTKNMVKISEGDFIMGEDSELALPDAKPVHEVFLDTYWIDLYEVTNEQYANFVRQTHHRSPWKGDTFPPGDENLPVVNVNWYDADSYCRFVNKRLPTEAQWEKAARGTGELHFPWGNSWNSTKANASQSDNGSLQAVGSYPTGVSPYGVFDMAGNVWEWTEDWYESDYYSFSPRRNPEGPTMGATKVMRGGAWPDDQSMAHTFFRQGVFQPVYASPVIGFRCVCTTCPDS